MSNKEYKMELDVSLQEALLPHEEFATGRTEGACIRVIAIDKCPRCKGSHENMIFMKFTIPSNNYTHWALRPDTVEPIMVRKLISKEYKISVDIEESDES